MRMSEARSQNPINFNGIVFVSYVNSETNRAKQHLPRYKWIFLVHKIMMNPKKKLFLLKYLFRCVQQWHGALE